MLLLIGCPLLQNALDLGQLDLSAEIPISKGRLLSSVVSILLAPYVRLLPASLLPPGVHFILLASTISHSVVTLELSYLVLHMSLSGSHLSWFCLLFPTLSLPFEPDGPQGPQRKAAFSSVLVHTPAEVCDNACTKLALKSISRI